MMKVVSPTYVFLRPLLVVLPWVGLGRLSMRKMTSVFCQTVLSLLIFCSWGWTLRCVFTCLTGISDRKMDHKNLAVYISYLITSLQGVMITACGVFYVPKKLYKVLEKSDLLIQDPLFVVSYERITKKIKIILVVIAIAMILMQPLIIYFGPTVSTNVICLQSPDKIHSVLFWINAGVFIVGSAIWFLQKFFIFAFIYIMCSMLRLTHANCNEEFKKMRNSTPTSEKIERVRKRYFEICDLTEKVDELLRPYLFMETAVSFTNICFFIHSIIYGYLTLSMLLISTTLVIFYLGCINFILMQGSCVYESTKFCLETTKHIQPTRMDSVSISVLMLFVENIKSTDVGLTILRLFTIDKSAVLMVFGSLISYVIVILQLQTN